MDRYLTGIIAKLSASGIRNVSKVDALKFLIMKDIETDGQFPCRIKRQPKTKKGFKLIWL